MKKQNTIKIHTAKVDNHEMVVALDSNNNLTFGHYGEFGCGPFVLAGELIASLKTCEPRTDGDRVKFVERGRYDIQCTQGQWYIYDNELKDSLLCDFGSWTEAVDALMDMEEAQ